MKPIVLNFMQKTGMILLFDIIKLQTYLGGQYNESMLTSTGNVLWAHTHTHTHTQIKEIKIN